MWRRRGLLAGLLFGASFAAASPETCAAGGPTCAAATNYHDVLRAIYLAHNPAKADDVARLLEKYRGSEEELLAAVRGKYGMSPGGTEPGRATTQPADDPPARDGGGAAGPPATIDDVRALASDVHQAGCRGTSPFRLAQQAAAMPRWESGGAGEGCRPKTLGSLVQRCRSMSSQGDGADADRTVAAAISALEGMLQSFLCVWRQLASPARQEQPHSCAEAVRLLGGLASANEEDWASPLFLGLHDASTRPARPPRRAHPQLRQRGPFSTLSARPPRLAGCPRSSRCPPVAAF